MAQRFALYYAPSTTDALWDRASVWLGRDPHSGVFHDGAVAGLERRRLLNITQSAGRYGFHATIKAPMRLAAERTESELRAALSAFAATAPRINLGPLTIANIHGFLALVPAAPHNPALQALAEEVVRHFEPFRAPLSARDRARRLEGLSPRQLELLDLFGYPYVADQFQFHMTLTDKLDTAEADEILQAAQTWFAPVLAQPVTLDRLCVFVEKDSGMAFDRVFDASFPA